MNVKELMMTASAIVIGTLLANLISKKVPMFSQFEDWESDEYDDDED